MTPPMIFLLVAGVVWFVGLVVLVVWGVREKGWEGVEFRIMVSVFLFFLIGVLPWASWFTADRNLREANQAFVETYDGQLLKFDSIELKGWRYQWIDSKGQYYDVDAYFEDGKLIHSLELQEAVDKLGESGGTIRIPDKVSR